MELPIYVPHLNLLRVNEFRREGIQKVNYKCPQNFGRKTIDDNFVTGTWI